MKNKTTSSLMDELKKGNDIDKYIETNQMYINDKPLHIFLSDMLTEKSLKKAEVIKKSCLNEVYGYHIFSGFKRPSRDKIICILIGMELDIDEINNVLKNTEFALLYPKNVRDSVIIWGISNGRSVVEINELLYAKELEILE